MAKGNWREFDQASTRRPYQSQSTSQKAQQHVRVERTRGGKSGKTVTVITGLELDDIEAKSLLKRLKTRCGSGGTQKGALLELQGDQVNTVLDALVKEGYRPKQSGG